MSKSTSRAKIEFGLNIVITIAVVIIAGVLLKRTFFQDQPNHATLEQQAQMLLGTRINIPGGDWARNRKSLIFFLKKDCVYCEAIAPAYRELISDSQQFNVNLIAILPNSVDEGRKYVESLRLPIESVQSGSLASYKIPGTPAVLMVDTEGIVRGVWFGAEPGRDREMREKLISLL